MSVLYTKVKRVLGILLCITCLFVEASAQTKEVDLCEVTVSGVRPERFMVGQKVQDIDTTALKMNRFSTLADFLQFNAPVAFKSYGAGQLATIAIRGTSASHTALLWNGININFPSLGLTDFSTFPVMAFDQMTIQYGSAASCVGTDAVGGSIQLRSVPEFRNAGLAVTVGLKGESSNNFSQQIGLRYNKVLNAEWRLSGKTMLHASENKNDFGAGPIKNRKGEAFNLEPTNMSQGGFIQDVFLQHKNGDMLSVHAWLSTNELKIQPDVAQQENTLTEAYRFQSSYQKKNTLIRAAFIRDITDFSQGINAKPSHTEIDRYILRVEQDLAKIRDCESGTNIKIGAEYVFFDAQVDGYGSEAKTQNRVDLYMLIRRQFNSRLSAAFNARQAFVDTFRPPFTPSLGVDYKLFKKGKYTISLPANIAYSYRVPTLNERYWLNQGNPNLLPEVGFNKEVSLNFQIKEKSQEVNFNVSVFHNFIKNWTYWNPDRNYKVENLQEVLAKGLEAEGSYYRTGSQASLKVDLQYALTNSSQQKAFGLYSADIVGKQLTYIPRHVISNNLLVTNKNWGINMQQSFNSKRYVTFDHSGRAFSPFYLLNMLFSYHKDLKKQGLDFVFNINNVTNTVYPNLKKNAMPGRTAALTIVYNFRK